MKVQQEIPEVKFNPITITIETLDEAIVLWAALGNSTVNLRQTLGLNDLPDTTLNVRVNDQLIHYEMFQKYNELFDARKALKIIKE